MTPVHTFTVRYTEPVLKRGVRAFVIHRLGGLWVLLALPLLCAGCLGYLVVYDAGGWAAGFISALLLVEAALVGLIWIVYWRRNLAKLRRLKTPDSTFALSDDRIAISNDSGAVTLVWSAFEEILDCGECWLLALPENQFVTLPVEGVSPDTLAFLRGKVPKFATVARGR
jgi:hypothetical protein